MSNTHPDPNLNRHNVLGTALASCCFSPLTGYYRDGFCHTSHHDLGEHTVCAKMTREFLEFSANRGNDLITPLPEYHFPGLQPNDFWCVSALRWIESIDYGVAPPIKIEACHESLLELIDLSILQTYAI